MNRIVLYSLVLVLTLAIVLPVVGTVNASAFSDPICPSMAASGSPGPPPVPDPPIALQAAPLVASGSPGPPPVPDPPMHLAAWAV
jgi:hypothetical protein